MLSVTDASALILRHTLHLPDETVPLTEAGGRILRETVPADRDFPPFNRVAMDGIAIRQAQFAAGRRTFGIRGMQRAGEPQQTLTDPAGCLEVMTGAMLPNGTDAVIRYEDVMLRDGQATVQLDSVTVWQNVHQQAVDRRAGDTLLVPGTYLRPSEIAVAASVGKYELRVSRRPRVALVSTGDELVGIQDTPLPYQIRRSNTYMLHAALHRLGLTASLHHLPDDEAVLETGLSGLLADHEVLVLSGGVSAGKADFVPGVLARLGVQRLFHKVEQRPGKPLWFGHVPEAAGSAKVVFALPGNPVSTFLCFYRYLLPFLRASLGQAAEPARTAQLTRPVTFGPALTYFLPVRLDYGPDGRTLAHPLPGSGSADFANLLAADAFLELPADQSEFAAGAAFPIWPFS